MCKSTNAPCVGSSVAENSINDPPTSPQLGVLELLCVPCLPSYLVTPYPLSRDLKTSKSQTLQISLFEFCNKKSEVGERGGTPYIII